MLTLSLAAVVLSGAAHPAAGGDHGKLTWFEGSWEQLLAEARTSNRPIFMDFWTDWCVWCKRLDADTFSDDAVAAAMKNFLCYSVDAESEAGRPLAEKFRVQGYPTLVFLTPQGEPLDRIGGYLPPGPFLEEAKRIAHNEGTVPALRGAVEARPDDLDQRYSLAKKLQEFGDEDGRQAQLAEIRRRDPEGKSLAMRRLAFEEVMAALEENGFMDRKPLLQFLEKETYPELLFQGWALSFNVEAAFAQREFEGKDLAAGRAGEVLAAGRKAWQHVPPRHTGMFGNSLAWFVYQHRKSLSDADLQFAVEVARKAAEAAPEAAVYDTLACCLHAAGHPEEALQWLDKAVKLEPDNQEWKNRQKEFGGGPKS